MTRPRSTTPLLLTVAGLALATYPVVRPYGTESGLSGASDLGSGWWLVAHACGMVGFVALALVWQQTVMWLATALLLPYYGAETYALHELGAYAVARGDAQVLEVADAFRYSPLAMAVFASGLLALAVVGLRLALSVRSSGALLAGLGLVTYLPQFFGPPWMRMVHGAVLGLGLLLLALAARRAEQASPPPSFGADSLHVRNQETSRGRPAGAW